MRHTLQILLQLRAEGMLAEFAIGGAIAASFYAPAVATEDLDIFAFLKQSDSGLLVLTPLYERLKQLGGRVENEYVVIGKWPVQILPAYTPLVEQAISCAPLQSFEDLQVPVVDADYLCAIALQTGRSKDYLRVHTLLESGHVKVDRLKSLIETHMLTERWEIYVRRFT
jgi:hypothetical protein